MAAEWGTPVKGAVMNISNPNSYVMIPGAHYTTTYNVSGLRTWFPGWETDAINDIRNGISNDPTLHGTCTPVYIRIVDSGQAVVQWRYDASATSAAVIPLAVYVVIAVALSVLALWLIYNIVTSVGEILVQGGTDVTLAMVAAVIIASATLLIAGSYFYKNVIKEAMQDWGSKST